MSVTLQHPDRVRTADAGVSADGGVSADVAVAADVAEAAPGRFARHRQVLERVLTGPTLLVMSLGLVVQSWAVGRSRAANLGPATQWLFWLGLLLVFVPPTVRILSNFVSRTERVVLALALPVALQLGRVVLYPTSFVFHDELIHANTLRLIGASQHLFGANSLLPVASYYPGMVTATDGVHQLTGLSAHTSAVVVLLLSRIVLTASIVGLVTKITASARAGCVASLIYTCNPQAFFFNSQFSYQSFALPLAVFTIYAFVSRDKGTALLRAGGSVLRGRGAVLRTLGLPLFALVAVAVSHHLTSMLLVLALGVWLLLDITIDRRGEGGDRRSLAVLFLGGCAAVIGWAAIPGNPVLGYLRTIGSSTGTDIKQRLSGHNSHQLFQSSGGLTSPPWERIATIASILILLVAVLPTVLLLRRWLRGRQVALVLLGLVALLYPIIPLGHITPGTAEVTDRASGFLFLGVGLAVAVGPAFRARPKALRLTPILTVLLTIVFVGGVVLGAGPTVGQLPGPFLVSADARSLDAANLAAARWERAHLPRGTRVYADRDAGLVAAAVGGLHTVTHVADGIDASQILLAPTSTSTDRALIRRARIKYVIVDQRDSRDLPNQQVYIESGEYGSENRTQPVTAQALHKLARVPGVQRVYSNGSLVIYDVRALDVR